MVATRANRGSRTRMAKVSFVGGSDGEVSVGFHGSWDSTMTLLNYILFSTSQF